METMQRKKRRIMEHAEKEEDDGKVNWLDLPDHLVASITDKLFLVKDYISFGAVCRSWRSVYTNNLDRPCPLRQLPLLMVPPTEEEEDEILMHSLYSLSDKAIVPNIKLLVPHDRYCRGSSEGWLITFRCDVTNILLQNPFSGAEIKLPPLMANDDESEAQHEDYLNKAVLSANPSSNPNYVIMISYGDFSQLALFKAGDPTWTSFDCRLNFMEDIIYWRDRFYLVDYQSHIYACDPNDGHPELVKVAIPLNIIPFPRIRKKYLVGSDGELLLIVRSHYCQTFSFEVYKIKQESSPSTSTWTMLQSLGGQALFIGCNSSLSFLASDFPGCKPDCIYFTDDDFYWYYAAGKRTEDMGVFNLADKTIEHFPVKSDINKKSSIWIQQTHPCNKNKAATTEPSFTCS